MPGEVVVLLHDLHGLVDAVLLAFDGQPRVVQMRAHAQRIFEHAHILIQRAKEGFDLPRNVYGTSHPIGRFSCYRNRVADGYLLFVRGRFAIHSGRNSLHPNAALRRGQVKGA